MARLWSCGFELQSTGAGVEFDTLTGTASINTTTKRSGAAALRCNPTAATGFITHAYRAAGGTARTFIRAYVLFVTLPNADCALFANTDGLSNFPAIWYKASATAFQAKDGGALYVGSVSSTITTGVWYRLQIDFNDASGDLMNVYIDGTQIATNVNAGDMGGSSQIRAGILTTATADAYFDDIAINDDSGAAQNGLPGAGSIVHLYPNAAGDNNLWPTQTGGTAGSANNFTRVNQVTPDDATSFNAIAVTGTTQIDDFNVTDAATAGIGASDTVTLVQVGHRSVSAATTTASIVTRLKGQAAGTTTESASLPVNITSYHTHATAAPKVHKITAYTNPQTSTAWTPTSVSSMQIGYRANVAQTTTRRVTSVWALVEYVPVNTTPVTGSVDLRWASKILASQSTDLRWKSSILVTSTLDARWGVASVVTGSTDLRWGVASTVSGSVDLRWLSSVAVTSALDLRWISKVSASNAIDFRWAVAAPVSGSLDLRWALLAPVSSATDLRWRVSNVVTASLDVRWAVLNAVSAGVDLRWAVRSSVSASTDLRWISYAQAASAVDLRWAVLGTLPSVTGSLDARWAVRSVVTATLDARWALRALVSGSVDLRWAARAVATGSVDLRWASAGQVTSSIAALWVVRGVVTGTLNVRWALTVGISAPLDVRWRVLHRVAGLIELSWVSAGTVGTRPPADVIARLSTRFAVVPTQLLLVSRRAPHVVLPEPEPITYRRGLGIRVELTEEL